MRKEKTGNWKAGKGNKERDGMTMRKYEENCNKLSKKIKKRLMWKEKSE